MAAWPAASQVPYLATTRPTAGTSVCSGGLCQAWALSQTGQALTQASVGRRGPVRILQIGDSHTEGERITAALQTGLQVRYGHDAVTVVPRGQSGATIATLERRGDDEIRNMIAATQPELIILAFGINDGFEPEITAPVFEARLRGQLARLRTLAPNTEILILGAPDGLGSARGRPCGPDGYGAPPSTQMVRDVQRRVAETSGVAYWDWFGRMGGACSAERLTQGEAPLMRGDRVHFTAEGADWIGRMLADDLISAWSGASTATPYVQARR